MNPLKQWRKNQRLRVVDVALRLEVSDRTVSAWEHGAFKPSDEAWARLSRLLDQEEGELRNNWLEWIKEQAYATVLTVVDSKPHVDGLREQRPVAVRVHADPLRTDTFGNAG
jgi:transcriptional regulator with XRE-family HTH domain